MSIKPWLTSFTGSNPIQDPDPITNSMPDLDDETVYGVGDGDEARSDTVEKLRDKLQTLAKIVGDSLKNPLGSICDILGRSHTDGDATQLRLRERASDPTNVADKGFIYTKDASGTTHLYYIDSAGAVHALTPATTTDEKVKVTSNDTTEGFLNDKLIIATGTALKKTEINDGGDEDLQLDIDVNALTEKTAPVAADLYLIEDSADSNNQKKVQGSNVVAEKWRESGGTVLTAGAIADGQVLTRSGTTIVGSAGGGGGGFDREQHFTAVLSPQETFTIAASAATNANTPCGYSVRVYVNGLKHRYSATSPGNREFDLTAANQVRVGGLNISDQVEIVYGV